MYNKILCVLLACITFTSCSKVRFRNNKRLQVTGRVVSNSGEPLGNLGIGLLSYDNYSFLGSPHLTVIKGTTSDENGDFNFTSLDIKNDILAIRIGGNNDFQTLEYVDNRPNREEALIDLGTVTLKKKIRFRIIFNKESDSSATVNYQIKYSNPNPRISIDNWIDLNEVEGSLNPDLPNTHFQTMNSYINTTDTLDLYTLEDSEINIQTAENLVTEDTPVTTIAATPENTPYEIIF